MGKTRVSKRERDKKKKKKKDQSNVPSYVTGPRPRRENLFSSTRIISQEKSCNEN